MPVLGADFTDADWIDPDEVPRRVITFGFSLDDRDGIELGVHWHTKSQLLLVQSGAVSCDVQGALWIVPPRSALWIPGGAAHAVKASGTLSCYHAFIEPEACTALPRTCCAIAVSPLLRELLVRLADLPLYHDDTAIDARLSSVLLDELGCATIEDLHLPMPRDARLRKVADTSMASTSARRTLRCWAQLAGMSERSFARSFNRETGMSFGRWRQQFAVMHGIRLLAAGASIQQVADTLGYESVPSFVTMFRRTLGISPGRYMAQRHVAARASSRNLASRSDQHHDRFEPGITPSGRHTLPTPP